MYYYAEGTDNGHTNPTGTMVQIVKGELRKVGDWSTYSTKPLAELTDEDKQFVGWYWYNVEKETRYWMEDETLLALTGKKAGLFTQLHRIYIEDRAFFTKIIGKLKHKSVWMFEDEIERRDTMADHVAREVKYVIYDCDDYGRTEGEPLGFSYVETTGDNRADEATAIKKHIAFKSGCAYEKVLGVGFYNAMRYDDYAENRDDHIQNLRNQLDAALKAAVWDV